jgi:hypothetical protein
MQAFYVLISYLLMAGGGLLVLYFSIKPFLPLPEDWFRFKLRSNWIALGTRRLSGSAAFGDCGIAD